MSMNAVILPHAPILLPEVLENSHQSATARVRAACVAAGRAISGPRALVVSPHAVRTGVYVSPYGDLAALGPRAPAALCALDQTLGEEIAERWDKPVLDEPLDHGVVVPLLLSDPMAPIVAIGLEEGGDAAAEVVALAQILDELEVEGTLIASANLSAGLNDRAPLTHLPGAEELEQEMITALERDAGSLVQTAPRLAAEAGSCAFGPLALVGHLFGGRPAEILAHEWPFGVGYLVATISGRE